LTFYLNINISVFVALCLTWTNGSRLLWSGLRRRHWLIGYVIMKQCK